VALKLIPDAKRALGARVLRDDLEALAKEPNAYTQHPHLALLAQALIEHNAKQNAYVEREAPAPYGVWGQNLEAGSTDQMKNAVRLPVAVAGALMPDAHQGYGLPIGGVLATHNSVIPYGVGVDIACRMKLSVLDIPAEHLDRMHDELCRVLERETVFGTGKEQKKAVDHPVLHEDWAVTPTTKHVFDKARAQIGTSGSGNHFVEFGLLTVHANAQSKDNVVSPGGDGAVLDGANLAGVEANFNLPPGTYVAVLSHSGSRGAGPHVARPSPSIGCNGPSRTSRPSTTSPTAFTRANSSRTPEIWPWRPYECRSAVKPVASRPAASARNSARLI
jgi:tRNA-splicing ligase RtcB